MSYSKEDLENAFKAGQIVNTWNEDGIEFKYDSFNGWFNIINIETENNQNEEIGKRFSEICIKLNDMGVFYGKNYSGKYHEKYGHELHWFALHLDKHRGGFESVIYRECDNIRTIDTEYGGEETPHITIIELLENTYNILKNELGDDEIN